MTVRPTIAVVLAATLGSCAPGDPAPQAQVQNALRRAIEASPCDIVDVVIDDPLPDDTVPVGSGGATGGGGVGGVLVDHGFPIIVDDTLAVYVDGAPGLAPDSNVVRALTGSDSWENEAHDCQRLILATTVERRPSRTDIAARRLAFGPLVGIFPLARAMALNSPWSRAMPVATIYNWGDWDLQPQPYEPLAITGDWHCLWMKREGTTWRAAVVPTRTPCPMNPPAPQPSDWKLEVVESHWTGRSRPGAHGVYPRTARWAWDAGSALQYVGIKCGNAWCSIGQTAPPVPAQLAGEPYRVVPGWYDQQLLAIVGSTTAAALPVALQGTVPVAGGPNNLMPGPAGSLHPDSAFWYRWHPLAQDQQQVLAVDPALFVRQGLQQSTGMDVARIELTGSSSSTTPYEQKFSLMAASGTAHGVINMSGSPPNFGAKFRGNGEKTASVVFVPGSAHSAPGAVRWRWQERDEKAWVSCEDGCCTIAP